MKSAYELAMERLERQSPTQKLTDAQKEQLADIDSSCRARIAERELFLKEQIAKAQGSGDLGELAALQKQLTSEVRRITEEHEAKKEKVRQAGLNA